MRAIVLLFTLVFGQNGYDLFQRALVKERAEGKLEDAARMYEQIAKEFAADRGLVAKALVQLGQCYEKLHRADVRKPYKRIVRDFADQTQAVEQAAARLAALGPPPGSGRDTGSVTRRVWGPPSADILGAPSPDGRYISAVNWQNGELSLLDLTAMERRDLTASQANWSQFALLSVPSPDGGFVAYMWFNKGMYELRVVKVDRDLKGGDVRVVYRNDDIHYIYPFDWTRDSAQILVLLGRKDLTNQIGFISVLMAHCEF